MEPSLETAFLNIATTAWKSDFQRVKRMQHLLHGVVIDHAIRSDILEHTVDKLAGKEQPQCQNMVAVAVCKGRG